MDDTNQYLKADTNQYLKADTNQYLKADTNQYLKADTNQYLKTDNNKVINEKYIKWIKKIDECLEVCTKSIGCGIGDTHKICKINNSDSYNKLNKHFN